MAGAFLASKLAPSAGASLIDVSPARYRPRSGKSTGMEIFNAIERLERRVETPTYLIKRAYVRAAKYLRLEFARTLSSWTGMGKMDARRRLVVRKARARNNPWVALTVNESASIVHTGRLKVSAKGPRVRTIKKDVDHTKTFLLNPRQWKKKRRRVYRREGAKLVAVSHKKEVADVFEARRAMIQEVLSSSVEDMLKMKAARDSRMRGVGA